MTTAIEALHEAQVRGVRLWVDEGSIHYAPKDAPQDVLDLLRQHKPELLQLLATDARIASMPEQPTPRQNEAPALPGGAQRLVDRFIAGQTWLWVVRDTLDAQPDAGVGSTRERRYLDQLLQLVDLERLLRFTYQFEGCARGELGPCDPLAVLRCEACADPAHVEAGP